MASPDEDKPLVLVAEDDEDILELISLILERSGYEVIRAADGEEALGLARSERPVLVMLDVMMPRLDGYEVTRRLRQDEATAGIPILLVTARVQDGDVQRGFEAGADDYLRKPFSPEELESRLQAILDRR
jgi:DNA-binding response OmpR family regulator